MPSTKPGNTKRNTSNKLGKFPKEIDIFSTKWRVKYHDTPYSVGDARANAHPLFGQCNLIDRLIEIYVGEREDADVWKTIFHEALHAVANELGMEELENSSTYEAVIDGFSTAIVDMILRNKIKIT